MPEPIRYDTQSDRELLIIVAQSINHLSDRTTELCEKVREHEQILANNKDKISAHERKLIEIMDTNSEVARTTTNTLKEMHLLLNKQITNNSVIEEKFKFRAHYGSLNRKMIIALWSFIISVVIGLVIWMVNNVPKI
jgi:hypothetical protein